MLFASLVKDFQRIKINTPISPLYIVVFEAFSQACLHSDVGRAPVWVATDAVQNCLHRLSLQWKNLIEGLKFESILWEPVHGLSLRRDLKQPADSFILHNIVKCHKGNFIFPNENVVTLY